MGTTVPMSVSMILATIFSGVINLIVAGTTVHQLKILMHMDEYVMFQSVKLQELAVISVLMAQISGMLVELNH